MEGTAPCREAALSENPLPRAWAPFGNGINRAFLYLDQNHPGWEHSLTPHSIGAWLRIY